MEENFHQKVLILNSISIKKKKMPFMKALVNPISIGVPGLYTMLG